MKTNPKTWKRILAALIAFIAVFSAKPIVVFIWQASLFDSLYKAIGDKDADQVKKLLEKGANPNSVPGGLLGGFPLIWATRNSDLKTMRVLIQGGADVNKESGGYTALMNCTSPETTQLLLSAGADPKLRTHEGFTAWQLKKFQKLDQVAKVIMRAENRQKVH